jgi:hypothetical protein
MTSIGHRGLRHISKREISTIGERNIDLATLLLIGYPMPIQEVVLDAAHIHLDSVISALLATEL